MEALFFGRSQISVSVTPFGANDRAEIGQKKDLVDLLVVYTLNDMFCA